MAEAVRIRVEVAYATPNEQAVQPLEAEAGLSVAAVIEQSGILTRFPEIDLASTKVGIFGKVCSLEHTLRDGDRVEIYRPLRADPKEARRARAAKKAR
ncbi:MAG TPA: RnfH family protein [Methylococcaceae bacterium]|nr:RnfH family protein [Methylococcaceae bacterium]